MAYRHGGQPVSDLGSRSAPVLRELELGAGELWMLAAAPTWAVYSVLLDEILQTYHLWGAMLVFTGIALTQFARRGA